MRMQPPIDPYRRSSKVGGEETVTNSDKSKCLVEGRVGFCTSTDKVSDLDSCTGFHLALRTSPCHSVMIEPLRPTFQRVATSAICCSLQLGSTLEKHCGGMTSAAF